MDLARQGRCRRVVWIGIAGALSPGLKVGDLVVATSVTSAQEPHRVRRPFRQGPGGCRRGSCLTGRHTSPLRGTSLPPPSAAAGGDAGAPSDGAGGDGWVRGYRPACVRNGSVRTESLLPQEPATALGALAFRVELAPRVAEDLLVPEVLTQGLVAGVEQPRPTQPGKGEHVLVVRSEVLAKRQRPRLVVYPAIRSVPDAAPEQSFPKPLLEGGVDREFLPQAAADGQTPSAGLDPAPELARSGRRILSEDSGDRIRVENGAHGGYSPIDRLVSSRKNCR